MGTDTLALPDIGTTVITEIDLDRKPCCEARLDGTYRCPDEAIAIVRFKAHGCVRDGHGHLLCQGCMDWISSGPVKCAACAEDGIDNVLLFASVVRL